MCSQHEFVAPELEPELVEMLANTTEAWKETEKERERVVTEAKIPEECRSELGSFSNIEGIKFEPTCYEFCYIFTGLRLFFQLSGL